MRHIFTLMLLTLSAITAAAQELYSWHIYPAYSVCTNVVPAGHRIYAQMESKLMAYDTDDASITTFDWQRQLNDVEVEHIAYCADAGRIVIVYANGNIDLLSTADDNDVLNLSQLKSSTLANKEVAAVATAGTRAFIATGFGIVVVDVAMGIIMRTYTLGTAVTAVAAAGNYIYAVTPQGLLRGDMRTNLQDRSRWQDVTLEGTVKRMAAFDGHIFAQVGAVVYVADPEQGTFSVACYTASQYFSVSTDALVIGNTATTIIFSSWNHHERITASFAWNNLTKSGNTYWAADGYDGLQGYSLTDNAFTLTTAQIHPNSPLHDYSYSLSLAGERLLVSGGNRNYSPSSLPGTAMWLEPDGTWVSVDPRQVEAALPDERYVDVTAIAQDPADASHHFVGTARSGLFELRNGRAVAHYGPENSPLQSILPDIEHPGWQTTADGVTYDGEGNLWMLNPTQGRVDSIVRVLMADGTWAALPATNYSDASTVDKVFFDSQGRAWLNSRRMNERGVILLDYNGTVRRTSDDIVTRRRQITNQDGTDYDPENFYCTAEDHEGRIWVGTISGPFVVADPDAFASTSFTFEQVKVARNDGSGLADYLLSNIPILSMCFDGGGRLWAGTEGNGVYLISADSQEELCHFTTDNSPLPSDNIYDIAVNGHTGEVYFATDKGLCSYVSDATDGIADLRQDDVEVFPNPVTPDYNGPIAVRGLSEGCEVKVVSTAGIVVAAGRSEGGTFVWNGRTSGGRSLPSGIYHVVASTATATKAVVARIALIR